MSVEEVGSRLVRVVGLITDYCRVLENVREYERLEFVARMLDLLPRIYWEFSDIDETELIGDSEYDYFPTYVDEEFYSEILRNVELVMGEDDVFLETFEEDMKYSDTPVAASIAESLADIFQPLYNFIANAKDSDEEGIQGAFRECKENFISYWAQTLCNVMRALNSVRYNAKN